MFLQKLFFGRNQQTLKSKDLMITQSCSWSSLLKNANFFAATSFGDNTLKLKAFLIEQNKE